MWPNFAAFVPGQAVIGAGQLADLLRLHLFVVGVQVQVAGRLLAFLCRVAGGTAAVEDRLDVAEILDVVRPPGLETHAGQVVLVPLLARLIRDLLGQQRRLLVRSQTL